MIRSLDSHRRVRRASIWALALLVCATSFAQTQSMTVSRQKVTPDPDQENRLPLELRRLGWDQNIGDYVDLELTFADESGRERPLGDFFDGERPVLLAPVYFECPMLCSLVLDGVVRGLKPLQFIPGDEFQVLAVSFDPGEDAELAQKSLNTALARYGRPDDPSGWSFLTGSQPEIEKLMSEIGFKYEYNEETGEYGHAGGIVLLTPDGQISRYFYGVDYAPKDLRLGFVEASQNKLGNLVDQVVLFCTQYDPMTGKYSAISMNIVRAGGILTVLALAFFIIKMLRAESRRTAAAQGAQ